MASAWNCDASFEDTWLQSLGFATNYYTHLGGRVREGIGA